MKKQYLDYAGLKRVLKRLLPPIDAKPTCYDTDGNLVKGQKIVELTKAQYDALAVKDPDTYYVITDAQSEPKVKYPRPDWANAVEITAAQVTAGYTVPDDGMLVGHVTASDNSTINLLVNEIRVGKASYAPASYVCWTILSLPVCANDKLTKSGTGNINTSTDMYSLHFVPWKGPYTA